MKSYSPKDLVAVFIIGVFVLMKLKGVNGSLDAIVALIIGYYFGHRKSGIDNGK